MPNLAGAPTPAPQWIVVVLVTSAFAALLAIGMSPRTALFWYIFPLFGVGASYLVQFRTQLSPQWKVTFAGIAVVSALALALDWPFSGHVLWNVVFIGHACTTSKRRSAWMSLLVASLLYLLVMKVAFQTSRDVAGAFVSMIVAALVLLALKARAGADSA